MKRAVRRLIWLSLLAGAFLGGWAFWREPRQLVVREQALAIPCWRAPPLRMAVLSDLHIGSPYVDLAKLERVVALTNAGHPDVVVLTGDYVIHGVIGGRFVPPEEIAAKLAALLDDSAVR